jgi:hypothetical protein
VSPKQATETASPVRDFSIAPVSCRDDITGGTDPMWTSWDGGFFGYTRGRGAGAKMFTYNRLTDTIGTIRVANSGGNAPQPAPSGQLFFLNVNDSAAQVVDANMKTLRTLDIDSEAHATLGTADGVDTHFSVQFDSNPNGNLVGRRRRGRREDLARQRGGARQREHRRLHLSRRTSPFLRQQRQLRDAELLGRTPRDHQPEWHAHPLRQRLGRSGHRGHLRHRIAELSSANLLVDVSPLCLIRWTLFDSSRRVARMKKAPASKKSSKTTKRPAKAAAKVAKKPAVKTAARKTVAKKKPAKARKTTRQKTAAFALDPRLMSCGCSCPGSMGAGMCGEPEAKPAKRKK